MKKQIHFIVNSRRAKDIAVLSRFLKEDPFWAKTYKCLLWESLYKGHTLELTQKAIRDKTTAIIACGGDGTINEVARFLVDKKIPLGIIPLGSGNGLARHLKIPLRIKNAIEVIKTQKHIDIDVGSVNEHFFICNMGVSFDASFIREYQKNQKRGFFAYFRALLRVFRQYKSERYSIKTANIEREVNPFLLMVCNTNQFGYNFSITPKAEVTDGKFELVLFKSQSVFALFKLLLACKIPLKLSKKTLEVIPISEIQIKKEAAGFNIQYDGETNNILADKLSVKLHLSALRVLAP